MTFAGSFADPTVLVACITSAGALLAIVLTSLLSQRNQHNVRGAIEEQRQQIDSIHIIVNSQKTEMEKRILALEERLGLEPGAPIEGEPA